MHLNKFIVGLLLSACLSLIPSAGNATVSNTTVSTTTAHGTGSTTNYVIGFDFRDNSWINVALHDTVTSPETVTTIPQGAGAGKFTVSGGNPGTTVVMGTAPTTTQYLVITRVIPLTQTTVFDPASIFPYQGLANQLDQITLEMQNLNAAAGAGGGGGGGGGSGTTIPSGTAYNLLGWDSAGATLVNYGTTPATNDVLRFNGTTWANYQLTAANLISTINGGATSMNPSVGGTGVANNGLLTWGAHALTFTLSADTNVTLPTSGTLVAGTVDTANTANTIVKRDASGNFSAGTITASLTGNVTGNLTGNVTGNTSGTSANVTGTVAIGHGGTGQNTQAAAITALTGVQTNHYVLRSDGTNAALGALLTSDLPSSIPWTKMAAQTSNSLLLTDNLGAESVLPTNVNSGYALLSDGVKPFWGPVGSGVPGIFPYGVDTGSANAYVVAAPNPPIPVLSPGIGVSFIALASNTGASTLNVSAIGAKSILHADGTALVANDILAGQMVVVEYDGTNFQLINPNLAPEYSTTAFTATGSVTAVQTEVVANCTLNCTLTLPALSSLTKTYAFRVKNINTTTVTVAGNGVDVIDGAATAVLNFQYQGITLVPTSSGWLVQ